jgi:hypothetical protein
MARFGWFTIVGLLGMGLLLGGCPGEGDDDDTTPRPPLDDDDSAADDDDATSDDDTGDDDATADDDTGDDDTGDDDTGDDDATADDDTGDDDDTTGDDDDTLAMTGEATVVESEGYARRQDLYGTQVPGCPGCEYAFEINYTTTLQVDTCLLCLDFDDGAYTLGYDADYMYGGYGPYELVFYYYAAAQDWYLWYLGYAGYGGHDLVFLWYGSYYGYTAYQYGFWDIGPMTDADGDGHPDTVDCDDNDPAVHPGAAEVCDGVDNDCDVATDETLDADGDGFAAICDADCDDADAGAYPGATELCDGLDNDCDGSVAAYEADVDGDGVMDCDGDCDDNDPAVYPGAEEICDGVDNDCVPATDENADHDADGMTPCTGDCDDSDATVYDGATELCDGLDNDCDGMPLLGEIDADGDGTASCAGDCDDADAAVYPGAGEVCDGVDNNCDGDVDEGCLTLTGQAVTVEPGHYVRQQDLAGVASVNTCPTCSYTFDIEYTTTLQNGSCALCYDLPDGTHTLGYDANYVVAGYGVYEVILYYYAAYSDWYFWYMAQANYGGHDISFYYDYGSYLEQYGYWDF